MTKLYTNLNYYKTKNFHFITKLTIREDRNSKIDIQGGSNMTGTDFCVNKSHMSRSYLNHHVC